MHLYISVLLCLSSLHMAASMADCRGKPADIIFVMDSSGSIWGPDFTRQLEFIRDVVDMFDVSSEHTRVGVISFGDTVHEDIPISGKTDKQELLTEITNIVQLRGVTNTDIALSVAYDTMKLDGRKGVLHLVIVLTDGLSDHPDLTRDMAKVLHDANIITFAIGIGRNYNQQELMDIASRPQYVFKAASFDALNSLKGALAITACKVEIPTTTPVTPSGDTESCGGKPADIVFVMDASGSILKDDFQKQLEFVEGVVDIFDISQDATHVAAMTFGNKAFDQFELNDFYSKDLIHLEIEKILQSRGGTATDIAIRHMLYHHFDKARSRTGVVKIGIIITDGRSQDPERTAQEAAEAKKLGVQLFAIGVGRKTDQSELEAIASKPKESFMFQVENYSALDSIKQLLAIQACKVEPEIMPTMPPADEPCQPDVVIGLPAMESEDEMDITINWIRDLVEQARDNIRFGLVAKDCPAKPAFHLNDFTSKMDMLNKLKDFKYEPANTAALIKHMREDAFKGCRGLGVKKIGVVMCDRDSPNLAITTAEALLAAKQGIELFVVAIGKMVSETEKVSIAGMPTNAHVIDVPDFKALPAITADLLERINKIC